MKIVIPMAGPDERFKQYGFPFPKPVVEIDGRPLIEHAFDCLRMTPKADFTFVIRKEDDQRFHLSDVLRLLDPNCTIITADGETAGAACTAMLAVEQIDNDEELVITNGDQILNFDLDRVLTEFRERRLDAGTVVFDSVHPRWSFVKTDAQGLVIEAAEKRPISRNATAGIYYFRKGSDFISAAKSMILKGASVNGGFFVCPAFNELILQQRKIGTYQIDRDDYISLATPQAVEEYEQVLLAQKRGR
jgi:NDP-sugar pyrophosphorylase family protein